MAALYGRMQGNRGEATRCGSDVISATLETWDGAVRVVLERDGTYSVVIGEKNGPRQLVLTGNVDERTAFDADGMELVGR